MHVVLPSSAPRSAPPLLFASVASGSIAAFILFYLAPLPIAVAGLGWGHLSGLIAAAVATTVVAVLSGIFFIAVPVIAFGAWWLSYLALLARPASNGGGGALEWYPVGRLVLWAAVLGTLVVAAAVRICGAGEDSFRGACRAADEGIVADRRRVVILVV